ncbi:MAG: hypothetical protein Q7W45_17900 [Bacteroidota bacterium]|nr:hypothetical protein [Bacteroidota bacterium]
MTKKTSKALGFGLLIPICFYYLFNKLIVHYKVFENNLITDICHVSWSANDTFMTNKTQ